MAFVAPAILRYVIFLIAYIRAVISRTLVWGGIQYRVLAGEKMVKGQRE